MHKLWIKMVHRRRRYCFLLYLLTGMIIVACSPEAVVPSSSKDENLTSRVTLSTPGHLNDETYIAYRNTHENSPNIPGMILAMIHRHMEAGEYQLARFYCDEYRRDYPSGKHRTEVEYLRIKALFLRYRQEKDDRVADQAKGEAKIFLSTYRRTSYRSEIQRLLQQLRDERNIRYEELAKYYEEKGKPKAAEFYRKKIKK